MITTINRHQRDPRGDVEFGLFGRHSRALLLAIQPMILAWAWKDALVTSLWKQLPKVEPVRAACNATLCSWLAPTPRGCKQARLLACRFVFAVAATTAVAAVMRFRGITVRYVGGAHSVRFPLQTFWHATGPTSQGAAPLGRRAGLRTRPDQHARRSVWPLFGVVLERDRGDPLRSLARELGDESQLGQGRRGGHALRVRDRPHRSSGVGHHAARLARARPARRGVEPAREPPRPEPAAMVCAHLASPSAAVREGSSTDAQIISSAGDRADFIDLLSISLGYMVGWAWSDAAKEERPRHPQASDGVDSPPHPTFLPAPPTKVLFLEAFIFSDAAAFYGAYVVAITAAEVLYTSHLARLLDNPQSPAGLKQFSTTLHTALGFMVVCPWGGTPWSPWHSSTRRDSVL